MLLRFVVISLAIAFLTSSCVENYPRSFETDAWKSGNAALRFAMIEDIRNRNLLKDKTKPEIEQLLGKPDFMRDYGDGDTIWSYKIINGPRCRFIWSCAMEVVFISQTGKSNGAAIIQD